MSRASHGGKGDRIPGTNPAAYAAGYPGIDWGAREREAAVAKLEAEGREFTAHAVAVGFLGPEGREKAEAAGMSLVGHYEGTPIYAAPSMAAMPEEQANG